jgi:hypothetical protein
MSPQRRTLARALATIALCASTSVASPASARNTSHATGHHAGHHATSHGSPHRSHSTHGSHSTHQASPHHARSRGSYPGVRRDGHGRIARDPHAREAFRRTHPCPSTGKTYGACPGWVVDHVQALKHGGADAPWNMQWQTRAAAKAKDRWE